MGLCLHTLFTSRFLKCKQNTHRRYQQSVRLSALGTTVDRMPVYNMSKFDGGMQTGCALMCPKTIVNKKYS